MIIIFLGFILRIFICFYLAFEGQSTLTFDAIRFHEEAMNYNQYLFDKLSNPEINYVYKNFFPIFIGYFYNFLNIESYFLVSIISCFIWLFSALILLKILHKLNFKKNSINIVVVLYTLFFPTGIVYSSLLLREVYILLLINLLALFFIDFYIKENKNKIIYIQNLLLVSIVSFVLLFFHSANSFFLLVLFSSLFFLYLFEKIKFKKIHIVFLGIFSIFLLDNFGILGKIFVYIKTYQQGHFFENNFERATYYQMEQINSLEYSLVSFLILIFKNFVNYLFQPFFYKVSSMKDVILLLENILRFILILMALNNYKKNFINKNIFIIFLLMYLIMEFIYAQATVNWGTASRHHLPSLGMLVLIAFFPTKKFKRNENE